MAVIDKVWSDENNSILITDKGVKVRHIEGREICTEGGQLYNVSDDGSISEDGIVNSHLGKLTAELVDLTEQLRQDFIATLNRGENYVNHYEERQEARRERYESRAEKAHETGNAALSRARSMLDVIPFGQPILIGHHSERRHRAILAKADKLHRFAFVDCAGKADHYESKAKAVGHGGISSDDPEALSKIRRKLQGCIQSQIIMKACNAAIRKNKTPDTQLAALMKLGQTEKNAQELIKGDFCGRIGFASYALQNNNAEINRLKHRIKTLEAVSQKKKDSKEEFGTFSMEIDSEENRILFTFPGKPDEEIRSVLKAHAFKWSPSRSTATSSVWVRKITPNALSTAQWVKRKLLDIK
ncbi:DUF3560 domain-containing protein [Dickeya sp. NCPPB 3274]|uniref:DUF3560 domain-containing protein n=1 Tax=Dickeya sp. NCPPB 3274 TaxID=568766 RepID=UPI0003AAA71A|nr:DUF3560 domain-containing protein [Dickeya sp. NCPPB 3274]